MTYAVYSNVLAIDVQTLALIENLVRTDKLFAEELLNLQKFLQRSSMSLSAT